MIGQEPYKWPLIKNFDFHNFVMQRRIVFNKRLPRKLKKELKKLKWESDGVMEGMPVFADSEKLMNEERVKWNEKDVKKNKD